MRIIPFDGKPLNEVREVRFIKVFGRSTERARIVSFGRCNYHCPYCRRDAQFVDEKGNVLLSEEVSENVIFSILEDSLKNNERIRLSGGDPSMHVKDSLRIAHWAEERGQKLSICHNGSSPAYIRKMAPYIEYAAIDLKAVNPHEYALRAGIDVAVAKKVIPNFEQVCKIILEQEEALLDVRTCVFGDTSLDDLKEIANRVAILDHNDRKFWTIRQYVPVDGVDWRPLSQTTLDEWIELISLEYPELHIGCRLEWSGGKFFHWKQGMKESL